MARWSKDTGPQRPEALWPQGVLWASRRVRPGVLAVLLLCLIALCQPTAPALALTTETFQTNLGALDANPASYRGFDYTLRDGSRAIIGNSRWADDGGVDQAPGNDDGLLITDWPSDSGNVREIDITKTGGGEFNFGGVALSNYTAAVIVTIRGYRSGIPVSGYDSGAQSVPSAASTWLQYAPASVWTGIDEVRITASARLDPYLDNFSYDYVGISTTTASGTTSTGTTFNGTVNPQGGSATVVFEYGTTTAYGSSATAAQSPVTGSSTTAVSAAVMLACGSTYHYRTKASIGSANYYGSGMSVTVPCNTAPTFVGATTTLTVSKNASATDIKNLLHASDTDSSQTLTWSQSTAPNNGGSLSFSSATASSGSANITPGGNITYTPASGFTGTETFTVQVSDGTATATRTITVAVKDAQTISFSNPGTQNFGTTPTLTASTTATGLTVGFTSATPGVCTITAGGALTFVTAGTCTINADQAGDATYAAAAQVSQTFSVAAVVPGAPTIGATTAGNQQVAVAFAAPVFTGGAGITNYTVTSSPGGHTGTGATSPVTVSGLTNGTAYTFSVTATNSAGTSAASAATASTTPKASQTISFANPGTQAFGTAPTLTASTTATGLTVSFTSATTGVCTITAGGALTFVNTGTCSINADQAGNGSYLAATTVPQSFTVSGPTIVISPASLPAVSSGVAYSQTLTASGSTAPYTFAVTTGSPPAGVTLSTGGVLSGTTTAEGSYPITVTATDSSTSHFNAARSYTLVVNPAAPVANAVSATVAYNSAANAIALSITGGAATSVAVASAADHGTATASGTSISYTPTTGYSGTDSFTYTATNGGGTSAAATVNITVTPLVPLAGNVSVSVLANSTANVISLNLTGGAPTSVAVASAPSHGTASVSGIGITYTPAANYTGADSFTYTATNSGGTSTAATVNITVQARVDPAKDAAVQGLITAQVNAAQLFAKTQISNFQSHLENLHHQPKAGDGGEDSLLPNDSAWQSMGSGKQSRTRATASTARAADKAAATSTGSTFLGWDVETLLLKLTSSLKNRTSLVPSSVSLDNTYEDPLGTGLAIWTAGSISTGHSTGSESRFTTSGVSVGSDMHINDSLSVGLGVGYGRQHQSIGSDGTESTGNSYGVMLYGSYRPLKGLFVDGLVGYNHLDFDQQRYVSAAGSFASSQRTGAQWLSSVSSGYEFKSPKWLLSPYGRLDFVSTQLDRSTESGTGIYDLVYFKQTSTSTKATLGLRGALLFEFKNFSAKPYARIEFQHDFADSGTATMAYADQVSAGTAYQYSLGEAGRNNMVLGGGADMTFFESWQLGLEYRYNHSSAMEMQTLNALLRKVFTF